MTRSLPAHFRIRRLRVDDYDKGYMKLLAQLTIVGNVTKEAFNQRFNFMKQHDYMYYPIVIEDTQCATIVAAGTVFIEHKFIHGLSKVAHMEDVVTHRDYRGQYLGVIIMQALKAIGKYTGCYKVILDCADKNVAFYERAVGMQVKENQMVYYYDEPERPKPRL